MVFFPIFNLQIAQCESIVSAGKELNPSILVFESRVPERGPITALLSDGLKSNFKNFP